MRKITKIMYSFVFLAVFVASTLASISTGAAQISGYSERECSERLQRGVFTREEFDECNAYARDYGYSERECSDRYARGQLTQIELQACNSQARGETGSGGAAGDQETSPSTNTLDTDCKQLDDCKIIGYLRDLINFMSALVAIVVVIMVVVGGLQYMTSRDNPQAVTAAKQRITNAVLALVVYVFIFAILEWLIPGGLF